MADKETLKKRLEAANFISHNGRVLRTINVLSYKYNELKSVETVLEMDGVEKWEFLDCINYLTEEKYIRLRDIATRNEVLELSQDVNYRNLEAKLTSKGIKLLARNIVDDMIEV